MTSEHTELADELQRLSQQWASLTERPTDPRTTMDVIEYGLERQRRAEVYVNRLLRYLLDPTEPHGMGSDFLTRFLECLPDDEFDEDTYDLADVRVNEQVPVQVENEDTKKYPDLVLDVPNEWVLVVELKFGAAESGTDFYAAATQLGDQERTDYESGHYYCYLHRQDKAQASSDCFVNWTWATFVADVLNPILTDHAARYPQRTTAQLHDFRDDLQHLSAMDDTLDADQEKIELYLDHVDAIESVSDAFDDAWNSYADRWNVDLITSLTDSRPSLHRSEGGKYPEITVPRADESERWIFRDRGEDWQHLFKYGWYKQEESLENLTDRDEDNDDLRIGFYHRMKQNRDRAVRDHELQFNFRNMGSNPSDFADSYRDKFDARRDEVDEYLAGTNGTLTGNKLTLIRATYDIPVDAHTDFFDAYTAALEEAFTDLVIENPELIELLGNIFEESVAEFPSAD